MITLEKIFNPLRKLFTHHGDAHAPTLYDYDENGYISPSTGRIVTPEEQADIDKYNDARRNVNDAQRKVLDAFLKEAFPLTGLEVPDAWGEAFGDAERTVSPIVLDLNGDGVQTTRLSKSLNAGTHFNLDAQGLAENTGWVSKDDGLLVRDLDGDGQITSGRELFGNHTLLQNGAKAANGFEALKELDDNADGVVDSKDAAFTSLWKDAEGDRVTDEGELMTLDQAGVQSLKVAYTDPANTQPWRQTA